MNYKTILLFLLLTVSLFPQEVVDKIVAVVDNEIILQSEVDFQTNLLAAQRKLDPTDPELKRKVLNSMIEDKLVYAQADIDSIKISESEISQRIDYQINVFTQQYGSLEKVEQVYGMSISKIKRELRDDVEKNLMVQKLQQKKFGDVNATRREVEDFYTQFKDSLGIIPEKVSIAHIYRSPEATKETINKYIKFAEDIKDSILKGADFGIMAKKYSEDPGSAVKGGDLGFVKKGVFYSQFESAAFALKVGEISPIIETPVGLHIIQLLEKRGESIHTRHILIKIKKGDDADLKAINFLTSIRDSIERFGKSFKDMAKEYSEDYNSSNFGGDLGTFYLNQLDKSTLDIVTKLGVGEMSFPRRFEFGNNSYGYHIVLLKERIPQHTADLVKDYSELAKLAAEYKKQKKYEQWIQDLKSKIFWKINS
ncbi:MAG: parvulin peptidyl-prolyl isomerase [Ignavibacteriales bacterium CG12_big_fil_rev_8_21_14_0_65_30_8]|nr:MAG: parvulin peptidyl-prolyl isomerase [Ignavibacteriales bacterium CG12_big_fil_rev_8_21_14_0_65_30_8]